MIHLYKMQLAETTLLSSTPLVYRIFDQAIRTTLRFPELNQTEPGNADFQFELAGSLPMPENLNWIHHWYQGKNSKRLSYSVGHIQDGYFFRFAAKANFKVSLPGRSIVCSPRSGTGLETVRHLLLDHVLPRLLIDDNELTIHASAIQMPDGRGVAFLGKSGWGKSTLAQSFHGEEFVLLGDDCLKLRLHDNSVTGIASYPGCRLWPDSMKALIPLGAEKLMLGEDKSKQRLVGADSAAASAVVFEDMFLLNDPANQAGDEIRIEPISGAQAIMDIVKCSFMLDVGSKQFAGSQFKTIQAILDLQPNLYLLSFPRRYEYLPEVRQRILSVVQR